MARKWLHIAKADFFVLTASVRKHRFAVVMILYALGAVWARIVAPMMMGGFISLLGRMMPIEAIMIAIFPGLMRSMMLFLFMILLIFPLSQALQEIKIGQWEIFLSNNVSSRDILTGTFLGSIPLLAFITLVLAPILISPFTFVLQVNPLGIIAMYTIVVLMVLCTLWLGNFITSLIQSRLGDSSRGNDIAKGLSVVIAIVAIVPMYGIMMFAPAMSEALGLNVFLLLPFTWFADSISWFALTFNGVGLTGSQILGFSNVMQLDLLTSLLLAGFFGVVVVGGALVASDRIFTISAGARTETVTTVGKENIILRGIRRINSGPFGALIVTSMKDYFRKAQNLSKLFYGVTFAIILPVVMSAAGDGDFYTGTDILGLIRGIGMIFAMVGAFPIAGSAFLESKDQLWIIQGAPSGAARYIKAKTATAFLTVAPLALIPVTIMTFMFGLTFGDALMLSAFAILAVCGAAMVSIGVTAKNPNYEDTKSPAHQANIMTSMMFPMFILMAPLFADIFLSIMDLDVVLIDAIGRTGFEILLTWLGPMLLLLVGAMFVRSGIKSLSRPEV